MPAEVLEAEDIACCCGSGVAASATVLALHRAGRDDARLWARGASGRARACPLRLDACTVPALPCRHDLPDLDVGVGVALRARRERRLTRRP